VNKLNWVVSGIIHGSLFTGILLNPSGSLTQKPPHITRLSIKLPSLGETYLPKNLPPPVSSKSYSAPPQASARFQSELSYPQEGKFLSLESSSSNSSKSLLPHEDFQNYKSSDLLLEPLPIKLPIPETLLAWEEGGEFLNGAHILKLDDMEFKENINFSWTGTVNSMGQWQDIPQASTGNSELDERINRWLRSMELRAHPQGISYHLKFQLTVRMRRPQ